MSDTNKRKSGLTAAWVKRAKPKDKPYKISDRDGLYLLIKPSGVRYWRMNYRFAGRQRTLSFGRWPELTLADARERLLNARRLLNDGIDPMEQAKLDQIAASVARANTFEAIAEEWLAKQEAEGRAQATLKKNRWLVSFAYPALGRRPITEITPHEVLLVLRKVETNERYETAKRIRSTCSLVFRYAIATARTDRDICVDLRGALISPKVKHRAAITKPMEAGALLRAIDGYEGNYLTKVALQLLPHIFVRPGELRFAEWAEFDLEKSIWSIPDYKTKMRRPHMVQLSQQAVAILAKIEHDASLSPFLFPSLRSGDRPMSDNTLNAALRRLGYGKDEMTAPRLSCNGCNTPQ